MTESEFRKLALAFPGAIESAHMDHPDFRLHGKIFATLGYPGDGRGMVKLTPEQQRQFIAEAPGVFTPCNGAWGRGGATEVQLAAVTPKLLKAALAAASENVTAKPKPKQRR